VTDCPYERNRPNAFEWTDKAFDMLRDGRLAAEVHRHGGLESAVVVGPCPRCGHTFRYESSRDAVGVGGRALESTGPDDVDDYALVDVRCGCAGEHAGRLADERGCGIVFRIEVRPVTHDG
jgi:hypothetical protein